VAQAPDADAAYDHLMGSPAHRANMVHPRYTHVGIAAVADAPSGNVLVTLVFARRAPVLTAAPPPAELQQRAQAFRRSKGLGAVQVEPSLQASAEAGARALAGGATPEAALEASGAELRRTSRQRAGSSAQLCTQLAELHELEDLEQRPFLASPALRQLGMAVALTAEAGSQRLWLLSVYTGPRCKE
jgi:hypothetical protein